MKRGIYSNTEILNGIKKGDSLVLHFIYDHYYKAVEEMVLKSGETQALAQDIFQEALILIYKKVQNDKFSIEKSSFFTYIYAVCKITLLNHYRSLKNGIIDSNVEIQEYIHTLTEDVEALVREGIKEAIFRENFAKLPEECKGIIKLSLKGVKTPMIAEELGFASGGYVRKRKTKCMKILIEMIKNDPNSKEVI